MQIRKYEVQPGLPIPDAVVEWLGVGFQNGRPVVWAVAVPGEGPTWVAMHMTGDEPPRSSMRPLRIGTAQLEQDGQYLVVHLWQVWP